MHKGQAGRSAVSYGKLRFLSAGRRWHLRDGGVLARGVAGLTLSTLLALRRERLAALAGGSARRAVPGSLRLLQAPFVGLLLGALLQLLPDLSPAAGEGDRRCADHSEPHHNRQPSREAS